MIAPAEPEAQAFRLKEEDRGWNGRVEKEEVGRGWKLVGVGPGGVD